MTEQGQCVRILLLDTSYVISEPNVLRLFCFILTRTGNWLNVMLTSVDCNFLLFVAAGTGWWCSASSWLRSERSSSASPRPTPSTRTWWAKSSVGDAGGGLMKTESRRRWRKRDPAHRPLQHVTPPRPWPWLRPQPPHYHHTKWLQTLQCF